MWLCRTSGPCWVPASPILAIVSCIARLSHGEEIESGYVIGAQPAPTALVVVLAPRTLVIAWDGKLGISTYIMHAVNSSSLSVRVIQLTLSMLHVFRPSPVQITSRSDPCCSWAGFGSGAGSDPSVLGLVGSGARSNRSVLHGVGWVWGQKQSVLHGVGLGLGLEASDPCPCWDWFVV